MANTDTTSEERADCRNVMQTEAATGEMRTKLMSVTGACTTWIPSRKDFVAGRIAYNRSPFGFSPQWRNVCDTFRKEETVTMCVRWKSASWYSAHDMNVTASQKRGEDTKEKRGSMEFPQQEAQPGNKKKNGGQAEPIHRQGRKKEQSRLVGTAIGTKKAPYGRRQAKESQNDRRPMPRATGRQMKAGSNQWRNRTTEQSRGRGIPQRWDGKPQK